MLGIYFRFVCLATTSATSCCLLGKHSQSCDMLCIHGRWMCLHSSVYMQWIVCSSLARIFHHRPKIMFHFILNYKSLKHISINAQTRYRNGYAIRRILPDSRKDSKRNATELNQRFETTVEHLPASESRSNPEHLSCALRNSIPVDFGPNSHWFPPKCGEYG